MLQRQGVASFLCVDLKGCIKIFLVKWSRKYKKGNINKVEGL